MTAGASATSAVNLGMLAAFQVAADAGNTKVSAILGTTVDPTLGAIGKATIAAQAFANTWATANGQADTAPAVVQAANDLVAIINDLVTTKKATRVVVLNLPDMSLTPDAQKQSTGTQALILGLSQAFNATLQAGLKATLGVPSNGVLLVDFFTNMQNNVKDAAHYDLAVNPNPDPAKVGWTVHTPVCKEVVPLNIGLDDGSSLLCTAANAGPTTDANGKYYMFADGVHPTPYSHKLLAQVVNKIMIQAGWL
jgi:phospholipase/lecithinase/hemolysin